MIGVTFLLVPAEQQGGIDDIARFLPSFHQNPTAMTLLYVEFALGAILAFAAVPAILTALALVSIVFFFSCTWNSTTYTAATGSAVLVLFFILSTIGRFGHHEGIFGIISSISIFRFLRARAIINGEINLWVNNLILLLIIAGFVGAGLVVFKRKDLPF